MRRYAPAVMTLGLIVLLAAWPVAAQTGGSVRGYIRDAHGAALPGVTVTAISQAAPLPAIALSDRDGYFRLLNLVPGDYSITADLQHFATLVREGVRVRAGVNLTLDMVLTVGGVTETVQVTGDTPMIETSTAVQGVNISGGLQRSIPLAARRHWSELFRLIPGAVSSDSNIDPASQFSIHGAGPVSLSILVDGADMTSGFNPWAGYLAVPDESLADVQIKTSGLEASAPLGMGAAVSVVTQSGTNRLGGSAAFAHTPKRWIDTNSPGGTSQTMTAVQPEVSFGGPISRNRLWFFGSHRRRFNVLGVNRSAEQVVMATALVPAYQPFDNVARGNIWFNKVTGQITAAHRISGFYSYDATPYDTDGPLNAAHFTRGVIGGTGYSGGLTSVWRDWLITRAGYSWNDKAFRNELHRTDVPSRPVYREVFLSGGRLMGSTQLAVLDNAMVAASSPHSKWTVTGDLTIYRSGRMGSHEFQAGLSLQPELRQQQSLQYANGGFASEDLVLRDPRNPASGTMPFRRLIYDADRGISTRTDSSDDAVYVQDNWRPMPRLTINAGIRIDRVTRRDRLYDAAVQRSTEVGPRLGLNYVLTADQRNAARVSFTRLHDAVNVNKQSAGTNTIGFRELYDLNLDGTFETAFVTPGASQVSPNRIIDARLHQPFVDEWAGGYRRQLPGQTSIDVGFIHREYRDRTALVEQNGIYEDGVFRGYRNENLNDIFLLTANRWNWPVYNALEIVSTKQTERLQVLGSYTRVWHHMAGTWQPNDPAAFIQPGAFANDRGLETNDNRSASPNNGLNAGTGNTGFTDHVVRVSAAYQAPWDILVATHYTLQTGRWSGPILTRLPAPDPQFGASTVRLSNGRVVSNPLATPVRFAFPTRSDGQFQIPGVHYWNLRVGRQFRVAGNRLELDFDLFNVLNLARDQGFMSGSNQMYSVNYGKTSQTQPARSGQLVLRFAF